MPVPPTDPPVRFTVSFHDRPGDPHFDLFVEQPGADGLATWNLPAAPDGLAPGGEMPARRIFDHRPIYLEFEGELSGGRGTVRIADSGTCRCRERSADRVVLELHGRSSAGVFELIETPAGGRLRRLA